MKLVILDRDGVINQDSDAYIKSAAEWIPLPGSIEAIARLSNAGYSVYLATNQSGLGRGFFTAADLSAMHKKFEALVTNAGGTIQGIHVCPHTPDANCLCRKPAPGLMDQIINHCKINDLTDVPVVGDSIRDLQAGIARNCSPVLVRTGKGHMSEARLVEFPALANTKVFDDLAAFTSHFLGDYA